MTYITDKITIGNSSDSRTANNDAFDIILNVAVDLDIEDKFKWRHKVGLIDGPGNNVMTFASSVLLLKSFVDSSKRVLIHCHEGKSRSVMVTSTYLALQNKISLDESLHNVMTLRNVNAYRPALYDLAIQSMEILTPIFYLK